jgi:hypothetical protein
MFSAQECQQHSDQCERMALAAKHDAARADLHSLAGSWRELAAQMPDESPRIARRTLP